MMLFAAQQCAMKCTCVNVLEEYIYIHAHVSNLCKFTCGRKYIIVQPSAPLWSRNIM